MLCAGHQQPMLCTGHLSLISTEQAKTEFPSSSPCFTCKQSHLHTYTTQQHTIGVLLSLQAHGALLLFPTQAQAYIHTCRSSNTHMHTSTAAAPRRRIHTSSHCRAELPCAAVLPVAALAADVCTAPCAPPRCCSSMPSRRRPAGPAAAPLARCPGRARPAISCAAFVSPYRAHRRSHRRRGAVPRRRSVAPLYIVPCRFPSPTAHGEPPPLLLLPRCRPTRTTSSHRARVPVLSPAEPRVPRHLSAAPHRWPPRHAVCTPRSTAPRCAQPPPACAVPPPASPTRASRRAAHPVALPNLH
ncbi:uncharacterized protein LOC133890344 [Phragmites australis]|uniref:uncharacterized protein LOC133890344 n=1 Tax=Phragmites australis TaxID=29695 RepID=UPI002D781379|nr:uncharacterized protein LOC133890344 [Phragmites australis]